MKSGLAFHCHHNTLVEFVYDYDERVEYIKASKPPSEQKLRLKLFQLIPTDLIPGLNSAEWKACDKAGEAYDKAWKAYSKAGEAYSKAEEAYYKAGEAYYKAEEAYFRKFGKKLELLHGKLCPDCPWDGYTIFKKEIK